MCGGSGGSVTDYSVPFATSVTRMGAASYDLLDLLVNPLCEAVSNAVNGAAISSTSPFPTRPVAGAALGDGDGYFVGFGPGGSGTGSGSGSGSGSSGAGTGSFLSFGVLCPIE